MTLRHALLTLALFLPALAAAQPFAVVPTPNNGPDDNILRGIDARTANDVWAVGDWYEPPVDVFQTGETRTLAMRWNGTAWNTVPTPNPVPGGNGLWDVAAVGPDLAWAVGHKGGNGARPMVLRWDGSSWADYPIPPISTGIFGGTGILLAMHDLGPNDIWAVGTGGSPTPGVSFVAVTYHWNGSNWELTIPPFVTDFRHGLNAVHGSAPDNVWAVGSWGETYGRYRPLVYRWDGQQWNVMPAPFNENPFMPLMAVQVLGPDDVWVTADRFDGQPGPVTAHWDGDSWTEYANPGGTGALVALGPDDVYGFGVNVTHWDGAAWTVVDEIEEREYPALGDATALPDGTLWAAGRWVDDGGLNPPLRTLAVRGQAGTTSAPVAVTAQPVGGPVTIPAGGGSFQYTVTLTNRTSQPQTFQAWTAVSGPVNREPAFGPQTVTLPAGATVTRTLTQRVPGNAPAGQYTYAVKVGTLGGAVVASSSFSFTKTGSEAAARGADASGEWSASGWDAAPTASAAGLPGALALSDVHPNPLRGRAQLTLEVPAVQAVRVEVFDALGRRVATLHDGALGAGLHAFAFDGSALPPGVYVVRATGETGSTSRRVTVLD